MIYHHGMNRLDHIVVAAATLDQGAEFLRERLGVDLPAGGRHRTMATHNRLLQLGDERYLELIAIDPAAAPPARPRWFSLDDQTLRAALRERPRLITWVMNTPDIQGLAARTGVDIGMPTRLSRDGLRWEIALPEDGRLLAHGMLPYAIQWHSKPHPARKMADLGCRLEALIIHHNRPEWIRGRLATLGAADLVDIEALPGDEAPYLEARLDTPAGPATLA